MRTTNKKILGAIAVAGVVAMTGSAFTAGISVSDGTETVGHGAAAITSGYTLTEIDYTLSADGSNVTKAELTVAASSNLTGKKIRAGFSDNLNGTCAAATHVADQATVVTCTFSGVTTASASAFDVVITDNDDDVTIAS